MVAAEAQPEPPAKQSAAPQGNGAWGVVPVLLAAAIFVGFATFIPTIAAGEAVILAWEWIPSLGIALAFIIDGLSLTFSLLISGIGTLILLYSNSYLAGHPQYARFALYLTSFMISMLGLVLADDLILLFVFWELTTVTSYLLIGFSHTSARSRRNALQALFVTGAGALAFLAGLILLGIAAGTTRISEILATGTAIQEHALYLPILILLLAGALTKSAQVPFHFWLPNAMAAPTPVSAFLHSATMVKGGVYLLARVYPSFSGTEVWLWTLTIAGATTAVFASVMSLRQNDLKQALAYTTLMALGTLTLLLGQNEGYAMTAFATFLVVHSLYKASLFLVVGAIDKATGTREADRLGGLGRVMPFTAAAAALAAMSMAGFPPFLGFISKELQYAGSLVVETSPPVIVAAAVAANALMVAVAGMVALAPFWVGQGAYTRTPKEVPLAMVAGPAILASLGLIFGLFPDIAQRALVTPIVISLSGSDAEARELKLWAGVNLPLFLSLGTFALGFAIYAAREKVGAFFTAATERLPNLDLGWDGFMDSIKYGAEALTARIQTGRLTDYLAVTFTVIAASFAAPMLIRGLPSMGGLFTSFDPLNITLAALLLAGAALTAVARSRIAAIAALGVVGIGTALVFIFFGAPDVAITQLMVEVLVVVLITIVALRLPRLDAVRSVVRPAHAVIAISMGVVVSLTMLAVLSSPIDRRLSDFFEAASWPDAFGRNIVNVILVDFRALDTFGEIAVVVIAAL
ncbi:MAG: hydrogen gas-evolving membrane-bound hydrogenase subunit E, partial [Pseudomonadota bacterium]